ncbi:MAG: choice-of-anchor D domain-containing protein [Ignavibacteria bacterium]|nr:choice-of-anchor D domain-containing protein [Ignavibacteria bacterium]
MKHVYQAFVFLLALTASSQVRSQTWNVQPMSTVVPGLWGISMFDSGRGIAVGGAAVGTGISGIVRKTTGNMTWQNVATANFSPTLTSGFPFWSGVSAVRNSGTGYVCGSNSKVYKTTDYGVTWNEKVSGISGSATFFDIFFTNVNEGMVVGANGSAYFTTNGGTSWTAQTTGTTNGLYAVHCGGTFWYVSGANNTMLKFGPPSTWNNISAGLPAGTWPIIEGLQFLDDQIGTFSGYNSGGSSHVFRTTNGGTSWSSFPTEPPVNATLNFYSTVYFFDQSTGWVANMIDPIGYTPNGGSTWTTYTPLGTATGAIMKLDFIDQQYGWAAGGALGGGVIGFVLKYVGPPPAPNISLTQSTLSFGTMSCGASKDTTLIVTNSGNLPLIINGMTFSSPAFSLVSPTLPHTIHPGQTADFIIRWTPLPTFTGLMSDSLTLKSNDPVHPNWVVGMTGLRTQSGVLIQPPDLHFPYICGTTFSDTSLTITPSGNSNPTFISLTWMTNDSGMTLLSPLPGTVLTGPTTFTFRLAPWHTGPIQGGYRLLIGNPTCPTPYPLFFFCDYRSIDIVALPSTLNFGDVCQGTTKDVTIVLKNIGNTSGRITTHEFVSGDDVFPNVYPGSFGPVPSDSSRQYTVRFSPPANDTGVFTGTYRLIATPCSDTVSITLTGRSVKPLITTLPSSLITLGPIAAGSTTTQPVVTTNSGSTPVTITDVRIIPPSPSLSIVGMPALPLTLTPGQTLNANLRFSPTKIEAINASLCFVWDVPCHDSLCIPVSAIATQAPKISARTAFAMGVQNCRAAVRDSFFVRNTGLGPLNLLNFDLVGSERAHFRVLRPSPPSLVAAGDSVPIVIEYDSPIEGTSTATLVMTHNDPTVPSGQTSVLLTGRREMTEFVVEGDTLTVLSTCVKTRITRTFTIRNSSTRPLSLSDISLTQGANAYTVSGPALPVTVPPAGTVTITLTFQPTSPGTADAVIRITSQPCSFTVLVHVPGEARRSPVGFNPTPLNFGTVNIGSTTSAPLQIANSGFEAVTISHILVSPPNATLAVVSSPSLPLTLDVGQSRTLTLEYHPLSVGSLLTSICVVTSAPCVDTLCIPVLGLARAEGITLDRDSLLLTLDPCSFAGACDTVVLSNNSAQSVVVTSVAFDTPGPLTLSASTTTPFTLNSGQSQRYIICADASFTGRRQATLVILSGDPNRPRLELPVLVRRDSAHVSANQRRIDFGVLPACRRPAVQSISLQNHGTAAETVDARHLPALPFATATPFPVTLAPGQIRQVDISFAPSSAGSFTDSLVLVTGRCGTRIPILLQGRFELENVQVVPSTLAFGNVGIGGSQTLPVTVKNLNVKTARVLSVQITPAGVFTTNTTMPLTVDSAKDGQIPIRFAPVARGSVTATACLVFDAPCNDTVCIPLTGTGGDGDLSFLPFTLAFPSLAQCEERILTDTLFNAANSPVTLTGSVVSGGGAAAFAVLDPVASSEQIPPGGRRVFSVRFRPTASSDGPVSASLDVSTASSGQPLVSLPLSGSRVTQTMPMIPPVAFGTIPVGTPSPRVIQITNGGSAPFTLSAANFPPNVTFTPPLPVTVSPAQTVQFTLSLTLQVPGAVSLSGWFIASVPCVDSLTIDMSAAGSGGMTFADISFGIVPNCQPATRTMVLRNELAQTARITGIRVSGSDASFFSVVSPSTFPILLAPRDSVIVTLRCDPDPAVDRIYTASVLCDIADVTPPLTASAQVAVDAREPVPSLASTMDFGIVPIFTSPQRVVVLRNTLPFAVRVVDVTSTHALFTLSSLSAPLPATLAPGDSITVLLTFSPTQDGSVTGPYVQVRTDQPCGGDRSFTVSGRGLDDYVNATVSIPRITGAPDQIVRVPLMLNTDVGSANVGGWRGSVSFNPSMLYPTGISGISTLSSGMRIRDSYDHANGVIALTADSGIVSAGTGRLAVLEFLVLIGNAVETPLAISSSFDFTSGRARVQSRSDGLFRLDGYCIDDGNRLVGDRPSFGLLSNTPNPFNPSTTITYDIASDGFVELSVMDAMGRTVRSLVRTVQTAGRHRILFDAVTLPSGVYYCILRSGASSAARPMVLSK